MSITARQLFYAGYSGAGMVLTEQSGLNPDQEEDARLQYNRMVDFWRTDGFTVSHVSRTLFNLVGNQGDYTIGPGGNWNTVWPQRVDRAGLVITSDSDHPEYSLDQLTLDEWKSWVRKEQVSNWPRRFYYEHSYPLGIVHLLYVPSTANKVALYLEEPISKIAVAAGTPPDYSAVTIDYQPGYEETVVTNLAVRIAENHPLKAKLDPRVETRARESLAHIKGINNRPLLRQTDFTPVVRANILDGNRYRG